MIGLGVGIGMLVMGLGGEIGYSSARLYGYEFSVQIGQLEKVELENGNGKWKWKRK